MKKLGIVLFSMILMAGMANAQNLLTNHSWETGDTTGWTACNGVMDPAFHAGPHDQLHTYGQAGCCGSWGSALGATQAATTDSGTTYDVIGWVKGCDGGISRFGTGAVACATAPTTQLAQDTTCSWTQGSTQVTGVTSVTVVYQAPSNASWGTAAVHFDDAYVQPLAVNDWVLFY